MSESISVHAYRDLVGIKPIPPAPKKGGIPKALGRLPKGEMNKTEMRYAEHLEDRKRAGEVLWYKFEPITFRLAKRTSLTVDFMVMTADRLIGAHDVKGAKAIYSDDAKAKMKIAAAEFWMFQFFVCFPRTASQGGGWDVEAV